VSAATLTRGPYLQLLTTTAVTVVWNTDTATTCSLEIWPLGDSTSTVVTGATDTICVLPVEALTPGTQYAYVPLADGIPLRSESIFRTDHPTLPYTFLVLGDHGYMPPRSPQLAVAARMLESPADFVLSAGDMIHPEALPEYWNPAFFVPYADLVRKLVFWPCLGNHDLHDGGDSYLDVFYLPANNAAGSERYYSFDYGNGHVAVFEQCPRSELGWGPGSAQYTFLDEDLGASSATWKFVVFHRTMYSSRSDREYLREKLVPLFDKHAVDMVFMGHDHVYERTKLLREDRVAEPGETGTVYVTTGGGGASIQTIGESWFTAYSESAFHFVRVSVDGGTLLFDMVRDDGEIRDQMMLVKGPPPECGDGQVNQLSEQCDGANDAVCPGQCGDDCRCPPVCGDGLVNQATEECDGLDDSACPALCLPDCHCGDPPTSLLVNGGFEEGRTGWQGWDSSQNAGEVVRTDAVQCEGNWSVQMFDSSSRTRSIYQDVAVVGGEAYVLGVIARTRNLGLDQARVAIEWWGEGGVAGDDTVWVVPGTDPCTPYGETYVAPEAATTARILLVLGPVTDGVPGNDAEVWYDGVGFDPVAVGTTTTTLPPATTTTTVLPTTSTTMSTTSTLTSSTTTTTEATATTTTISTNTTSTITTSMTTTTLPPIGCPASPAGSCETTWGKMRLQVKETNPGKEKMSAQWQKGSQLAGTAFGNPLNAGGTAYTICIYDGAGGLAGQYVVDRAGDTCVGKACWRSTGGDPPGNKGYKYNDKDVTSDGIQRMQLKGGDVGKSKLSVKGGNKVGKGQRSLPTGVVAQLTGSTSVTVQLFGSDMPKCFSATLMDIQKDDGGQFKAR
jgi:hypothetical protein